MASHKFIFLLTSLFLLNSRSSIAQTVVKGVYWFPQSEFPVSDINSALFTHLFCAFADLNSQSYQVTISSTYETQFSTFTTTVQQKNPSAKTLLSIGGGNSTASDFASMASQSSSRKAFIDSSISLARSHNFHGLDLDWESPRTTTEMSNMGVLLDEWRSAVANESRNSGKSPLLLSAAVYYSSVLDGVSFPISAIGRSLDWINVMAYDFYMPSWYNFTGAHAILYDSPNRVSASSGIQAWINSGLSAKKIVLGLPYYGYAWNLVNSANNGVGAPATGPAAIGGESGAMRYVDIKTFIQNNRATAVYNATIGADYCYSGTTWIGFDDVQTIAAKIAFAKQEGILGYFAWHVANDNNWVLSQEASTRWDTVGIRSFMCKSKTG